MESPIAYQGIVFPASRYLFVVVLPRPRYSPKQTSEINQAIITTQSSNLMRLSKKTTVTPHTIRRSKRADIPRRQHRRAANGREMAEGHRWEHRHLVVCFPSLSQDAPGVFAIASCVRICLKVLGRSV